MVHRVRSFIFNFKLIMIKKSLLTALVLLVGYSVFVALSPRVSTQAQHFYYNNLALAQRYLYQANKTSHAVIVGSSLASKIRVDSLAGFYNLALVGQGVHDGLRIVALAPVLPTDVYLETNMILVLPNSTFFSQNFSFLPRKLGEFWTVLHAD